MLLYFNELKNNQEMHFFGVVRFQHKNIIIIIIYIVMPVLNILNLTITPPL